MGFTPDADPTIVCEREAIHLRGSIQPHGVLLLLDEAGTVVQLAGDTERALGLPPEAVVGRSVATLVDADGSPLLAVGGARHAAVCDYAGRWCPAVPGQGVWDITRRVNSAGTILEFEPAAPAGRSAAECMAELGRAVAALEVPQGLEDLFDAAAAQVRQMTGFDRVLVCRFLENGVGTVIAEARGEALPSLLHHRFPGPDLPREARRLYLRNRFRAIPDTGYTPALLRASNPVEATAMPLDMSDCALRSVSPAHLMYLQNMGVAASMSISIVVDNLLWGLIACHHSMPRHVSYELRETCRHVGGLFSRQIEAREETGHHRQGASLRGVRTDWIDRLRLAIDAGKALELVAADLPLMIPCDGAAIVAAGRVQRFGRTPEAADVWTLASWLEEPLQRDVFATRHLARELPSAISYATETSGVLAVAVDAPEPIVILWFRVEEIGSVERAGNPLPAADHDAPPSPHSPRPSFESRDQTIRHTARAWTRAEIGAARQLGRSLGALVQQQALRDLNARLREALTEQRTLVAQKNLLMQEVHHRVQNSLQIVNAMLQLQARQTDDAQVRGQFESAVNRLMAVSAVHRHLWRSSDAQNVHLGPYLRELCADLMRSWGEGWAGRVDVTAGEVIIPSQIAVTLALLVTELLTNAAKYAYAGAPGPVAVLVSGADDGVLRVSVADRGRGMQAKTEGSGLGSKLIRIFTGQLGGQIDTRTGTEGTTVTIAVPLSRRSTADLTHSVKSAPA